MGLFILRRVGIMILTALCLTFIVFFLTNLYPNLEKLAKNQGNFRMTDTEVATWLSNRGYRAPLDDAFLAKIEDGSATDDDIAQSLNTGFDPRLFRNYGEWIGIVPGYLITGSDGNIRGRCFVSALSPDEYQLATDLRPLRSEIRSMNAAKLAAEEAKIQLRADKRAKIGDAGIARSEARLADADAGFASAEANFNTGLDRVGHGDKAGDIKPSITDAAAAGNYCGILQGKWGFSTVFKEPVGGLTAKRLGLTGWLMLTVMLVMVPGALIVGVLAGMREGSKLDRSLSTFSITTTATPEYVSGVIFIALLASSASALNIWLAEMGWIDGKTLFKGSAASAMKDIQWINFTLPVITIALYGMGYVARMTRASMAEVMTAQYIRTARLKGVSFRNIVMKHALRNALIAPFTVIMLQFPWLLNGVVIVETLFNYKGFGWLLVQAAGNNDIDLLLSVSVVSVIVVLVTQLISDIGYVYLNPRIRVS